MSKLVDKLRPRTKERVGKVVPCSRCGCDAEYYSPNYIHCERCDKPAPKAQQNSTYAGDLYFDDWGDLELEETTKPGVGPACEHRTVYYATIGNVTGNWCYGCGKLMTTP